MKILTINCGSSSVKYSLWDMDVRERVCEGIAERVTLDGSFIKHKVKGKTEEVVKKDFPKHDTAIAMILSLLTDRKLGVIDDVSEIGAVGHRVVHGGRHFTRSVKIDESVIRVIEQCSRLAPLHNPPNLLGIKMLWKRCQISHILRSSTRHFCRPYHPTHTCTESHMNGMRNSMSVSMVFTEHLTSTSQEGQLRFSEENLLKST